MILSGPLVVIGGLLVVAGIAKLRQPEPVQPVLNLLGLPSSLFLIRAFALFELFLGVAVATVPVSPIAWGVAGLYLAFAVISGAQLWRGGPSASCGCFGAKDIPPTFLHVLLNLAAAAVAVIAAVTVSGRPYAELQRGPAHAVGFLIGVTVAAYAAYLAITWLPQIGPARESSATRNTKFALVGATARSGQRRRAE